MPAPIIPPLSQKPDYPAKDYVEKAMRAIRAGANPNGPVRHMVPDIGHLESSNWSLLHILIEHHQHDLIKEVLAKGASLEPSLDQICHPLALLSWGFLPSLAGALQDQQHVDHSPSTIVSLMQENDLSIFNMLVQQGVRTDPQSFEDHQNKVDALGALYVHSPTQMCNPLWGLLSRDTMSEDVLANIEPLVVALLDKGIGIEPEHLRREPNILAHLEQMQALRSKRELLKNTLPRASSPPPQKDVMPWSPRRCHLRCTSKPER